MYVLNADTVGRTKPGVRGRRTDSCFLVLKAGFQVKRFDVTASRGSLSDDDDDDGLRHPWVERMSGHGGGFGRHCIPRDIFLACETIWRFIVSSSSRYAVHILDHGGQSAIMIGLTEKIHPLLSQSLHNEISPGRSYFIGESDTNQKMRYPKLSPSRFGAISLRLSLQRYEITEGPVPKVPRPDAE
ncbi:hypothetical protein CTAM01_03521 [Colletotrichum tamarilloi]|uniref:Uncharacterized protein n=1 Tax=Colletotrichum tamarilloi TaxID=1209934 RepID=A0ABQ9RJZ9_9PEZI|nr:uncharacterized protein CTAM01_03521 [Colletotrichum tamarilloi]KAK1506186.1 hypothetical protein CTAM01_03521 [Colletotrichum tamarilloi]